MDSPVGLGSVGEPVTANQQGECREGLLDRANPRKHRVQPDGKNKPAAGHSGLIAAICSDLQPKGLDAMTEDHGIRRALWGSSTRVTEAMECSPAGQLTIRSDSSAALRRCQQGGRGSLSGSGGERSSQQVSETLGTV
ncbi:uncharacterized protein P884DRAFT_319550 [Thermothelomyces heterothallicus CBS 202.75]|uniref:uncharacterized protein n=1 Tax=Thermothelomyces heterothallicus CBS 202.75 TaxID=1149848 RepID=UPI00374324D5